MLICIHIKRQGRRQGRHVYDTCIYAKCTYKVYGLHHVITLSRVSTACHNHFTRLAAPSAVAPTPPGFFFVNGSAMCTASRRAERITVVVPRWLDSCQAGHICACHGMTNVRVGGGPTYCTVFCVLDKWAGDLYQPGRSSSNPHHMLEGSTVALHVKVHPL